MVDPAYLPLALGKVKKQKYQFQYTSTATECILGEKTVYDEDPVLIQRATARGQNYISQKVIKRCVWCAAGSYALKHTKSNSLKLTHPADAWKPKYGVQPVPVTECKECPKKGADCGAGGHLIRPKGANVARYWGWN